jgi:acyl-CoA thioester hydrolase
MTSFSWQVRVYYEDTDAGGVVFHANYLKFLERARTEMLRAYGFEHNELLEKANLLFVVRSLAIDYLIPAKFNDVLEVDSHITAVKQASFMFEQVIKRGERILCKAEVCIACIDANRFRPIAIPNDLKATFARID